MASIIERDELDDSSDVLAYALLFITVLAVAFAGYVWYGNSTYNMQNASYISATSDFSATESEQLQPASGTPASGTTEDSAVQIKNPTRTNEVNFNNNPYTSANSDPAVKNVVPQSGSLSEQQQ